MLQVLPVALVLLLQCLSSLYTLNLQEADLRRKAKRQEAMQDEYAKIKNKLKNMDIELHTEVTFASNKACTVVTTLHFQIS